MSKLLTIAIPTYNRAGMLNEQLAWFASEIKGHEAECDMVINDNCSTDNTPDVVSKWQSTLETSVAVAYNRHPKNIGGMANIVASIQSATGKYVWTLGDDDPIEKGTLAYTLKLLKTNSNVTLILLNGIGRDKNTNEILIDRWFDSTSDKPSINSRSEFEYYLNKKMGGVLFISSAVYHSQYVKEALATWPDSARNVASQAYWVAYCALKGSFIVTPTIHTECAMGIGFTDKDPQWPFKLQFMAIPEMYLNLMKAGYSKKFCFSMILRNFRNGDSRKVLLGGFKRWFLFATKGFIFYCSCVLAAAWLVLIKEDNERSLSMI